MARIKSLLRERRLILALYDALIFLASCVLIMLLHPSVPYQEHSVENVLFQSGLFMICMIGVRCFGKAYNQVWRYSRVDSYIRLMMCDIVGGAAYMVLSRGLSLMIPDVQVQTVVHMLCSVMLGMIGSMAMRFGYVWIYELAGKKQIRNKTVKKLLERLLCLPLDSAEETLSSSKIRIAIIGAGRIGAMLAEELISNRNAVYTPVCFVDVDREKIGREIVGVRVVPEDENIQETLKKLGVQEIVFAMPPNSGKQKEVYDRYKDIGLKIKSYAFPIEATEESGKRQIREFDIEELLFRQQIDFLSAETMAFYQNRVILISGGGGSIGSELARQIAKTKPKQLVLLDIYENSVYDIQQEMQLVYGDKLNLAVEIGSVRDRAQLDKIFRTYHPDIVLHAAAHKHVPLMEHNCSEAVKNNVFGTLNMVETAEKYGVQKFIMISTDKAVNPTNIMGASKRLCEMLVLSRAAHSRTSFSCTRFGNVLGSNGSVIPLFKRQIANGGPITLTDRRIIRYFMTIPEASQLVLTSGAMAQNGELFVLDMGRPVKILDLAENMIRLSGLTPYKDISIVETGLRPGEKLFEELLIKTEKLKKTDNDRIFVERDEALTWEAIEEKLAILRSALATEDEAVIRKAMKQVVPTYHNPNKVNHDALEDGRYVEEAEGRQRAVGGY